MVTPISTFRMGPPPSSRRCENRRAARARCHREAVRIPVAGRPQRHRRVRGWSRGVSVLIADACGGPRQEHGSTKTHPAMSGRTTMSSDGRYDHSPQGGHDYGHGDRSEEHTSELQSLMRNSYADLCLKKKNTNKK